MKTTLQILAISILAAQFTFAQKQNYQKQGIFNFGLTAGINPYHFEGTGAIGVGNNTIQEMTNFYFEGFTEFNLSEKFSLRGEVVYNLGVKSDVFEVPLILRYKLSEKFYIYAGGQLNY